MVDDVAARAASDRRPCQRGTGVTTTPDVHAATHDDDQIAIMQIRRGSRVNHPSWGPGLRCDTPERYSCRAQGHIFD